MPGDANYDFQVLEPMSQEAAATVVELHD
jgi:hypothetical protein